MWTFKHHALTSRYKNTIFSKNQKLRERNDVLKTCQNIWEPTCTDITSKTNKKIHSPNVTYRPYHWNSVTQAFRSSSDLSSNEPSCALHMQLQKKMQMQFKKKRYAKIAHNRAICCAEITVFYAILIRTKKFETRL